MEQSDSWYSGGNVAQNLGENYEQYLAPSILAPGQPFSSLWPLRSQASSFLMWRVGQGRSHVRQLV